MNEMFDSDNIEFNGDFNLDNESCDYENLIARLKEIKKTIALLEKTIFK